MKDNHGARNNIISVIENSMLVMKRQNKQTLLPEVVLSSLFSLLFLSLFIGKGLFFLSISYLRKQPSFITLFLRNKIALDI